MVYNFTAKMCIHSHPYSIDGDRLLTVWMIHISDGMDLYCVPSEDDFIIVSGIKPEPHVDVGRFKRKRK